MNRIFVSYSRKDAPWVKRLYEHLRPLIATGYIELWSDADITPGENWRTAIQRSIESANAIIIIISPDYFASDFIANNELPQLIDVSRKRSLPIIPIIVRSTAIRRQIEGLQAINPDGKALDQLSQAEQDAVMMAAAERIRELPVPKARKMNEQSKSDPHTRAIDIAISSTGVSGTINVSGGGNIFVDAERKIREDEKHGKK